MRKFFIALAVTVVVIIAALLIIPAFVNVNKYHDRIEAELQQKLARPVTIGTMHLRLIPVRITVDNLVIGDDQAFQSQRPFAQAQQVSISPKILPLLHGEVALNSVTLVRPQIELVRNAQGVWSFSTIGKRPQKAAAPGAQQPAPTPTPQQAQKSAQPALAQPQAEQPNVALGDLKIEDGQVAVTDWHKTPPAPGTRPAVLKPAAATAAPGTRQVYDHIDLELKNFAPGKQFSVDAAAHLPGPGAETFHLTADVGPLNMNDMTATPIDGKLSLKEVSIAGLQQYLKSPQLAGTDASLSGDATLKNQDGQVQTSGSLRADQVRLHDTAIDYPITADFNIADNLKTDQLNIHSANIKLGSTPLSVSGTVDAKATPAQVDLKLNANDVSLAEVARLAAASGVAFNRNMNVAGRLTADVTAKGAAKQPVMNGKISARDLVVSGGNVPQPVRVPAIELALDPQAIRSNNFTASTGGTNLNGQFTLTNYASPAPAIDATFKTANANVGEILNIAKSMGVTAAEDMSGSGQLNLNVRAQGPLKNPNLLVFSGNGSLTNASVKTATMTQPLHVRNLGLQFTQNAMTLQNINASLGNTNATGQVTVRNFAAPQLQFTLNADKVNVAELQQIMGSSDNQPATNKRASLFRLVPEAEAAAPAPSPLTKMTGGGVVNIGSIVYDQLVLNSVKSNVTLDHGIIRMQPLTAQIYGGMENGAITVDTRQTPMSVVVSSNLNNVDANKLVSSMTSIKQTIYGLLAANTHTSFAIPQNSADLTRTLNGNLSLNLSKGRIAGIDMLSQLASVGKFLNGAGAQQAKPFTDLLKLTGNFNIVNGVANTNDLKAIIPGGSLAAKGLVNLAASTLNLHLTAVLDKAMSEKVGGSNIGGFMQTALANRAGELVIPVLVTGSFNAPHFEPDVQTLAQMKLQNLLPTSANPGALTSGLAGLLGGKAGAQGGAQGALSGVLGALTGKQQQQQQQQNANQPQQQSGGQNAEGVPENDNPQQQNPLGGLIGGLLNKKKNQQQQQQQAPAPQQPPVPQPPPK